jgi:hypothetical protein
LLAPCSWPSFDAGKWYQKGFRQLTMNQGGVALGDTLVGTLGNRLSVPVS